MSGRVATDDADTVAVDAYRGEPSRARLVEVALFFLKLGVVGFGGPLVHIAMMEDELVGEDERGWADDEQFAEGLAVCNTLPGPASTQLGIFMGWVRAGRLGALVAGVSFMLPTFLIVVGLSYVYFEFGGLPSVRAFFYGVNPVVIGLIGGAALSMGRSALGASDGTRSVSVAGHEATVDLRLAALLAGALAATVLLDPNPVVEFALAGALAVAALRPRWLRANAGRAVLVAGAGTAVALTLALRDRLFDAVAARVAVPAAVAVAVGALWSNLWVRLALFMLYTGSFIFGGGLVLIPFIETFVVDAFGWLTGTEFVDGIAIGQLTPGPVVMTTAFVGYKLMLDTYGSVGLGVVGAFVAAFGAFAPSFLFVTLAFPFVARVRENSVVRAALWGVNAAVVGAIVGATAVLAVDAFAVVPGTPTAVAAWPVDPVRVALATATFVLFGRDVDAAYLIVGGGLLGAAVFALL